LAFDHAIVQAKIDGTLFYLDPTRLGQHGRLDRMGQMHEGAQGLPVSDGPAQFVTIVSPNAAALTRSEIAEAATISRFGADGQLQFRQVWNGLAAESLRVATERMARERFIKSVNDSTESRYPGARLVGDIDINDDRVNNVFSVSARYDVPKLANESDGNWYVRLTPGNLKNALPPPASMTRTVPLAIGRYPLEASYVLEVTFPEEVSVMQDPRATSVGGKYFSLTVASSFRGNVSKTSIDLKTLADRIEVEDLKSYAEDLRGVEKSIKGVIVVRKDAIKGTEGERKSFAQVLRDRLQEVVNRTSETIKSGKLAGRDLAVAYCARSDALSNLGQTDEALRDANEAVKLAPNSPELLGCRAEEYFRAGSFGKSIADYSKAISLGDTDPRTFHLRGISNFYAGRLDAAAADFTRGADTADKEAQVYSDLWLTWTHLRLHNSIPEPVLKRAAAQPRGDWPRPALAMLTGALSPEDMLSLLDRKSGDDRQMALTEGYFYLGQYHLTRGNREAARELFEKTRELDVVIYTEHIAAEFELQRLGDH